MNTNVVDDIKLNEKLDKYIKENNERNYNKTSLCQFFFIILII